jgi:hypothetical protein
LGNCSEFGSTVLAMVGPAVSQDAENIFWGGITTATKVAIAALVPVLDKVLSLLLHKLLLLLWLLDKLMVFLQSSL